MSDMLLPAPDDPGDCPPGNTGQRGTNYDRATRTGASRKVLTKEECLRALSAMPGLVIMGQIPANRANTLIRIYQTILDQYSEGQSGGERAGALDAVLLEQVRSNPSLLNALGPLLTDDQFALLSELVTANGNG